jgi:hypothetical protein
MSRSCFSSCSVSPLPGSDVLAGARERAEASRLGRSAGGRSAAGTDRSSRNQRRTGPDGSRNVAQLADLPGCGASFRWPHVAQQWCHERARRPSAAVTGPPPDHGRSHSGFIGPPRAHCRTPVRVDLTRTPGSCRRSPGERERRAGPRPGDAHGGHDREFMPRPGGGRLSQPPFLLPRGEEEEMPREYREKLRKSLPSPSKVSIS